MSVRHESFKKDTLEETCSWLREVMKTIEGVTVYSITIVPMLSDDELLGWETTILWNDKNEYVR